MYYIQKKKHLKKRKRRKETGSNVVVIGEPPRQSRKIKDMRNGETGYAVPWAYSIDDNKLNLDFTIHPTSGGTVEMKVKRTQGRYEIQFPSGYEC